MDAGGWGGIEKPAARRATTHFPDSSICWGTHWGTPKLVCGGPNSWHHTTDTGPPNRIIQRLLQHAKPRPLTANKGRLLTREERKMSWQTGPVARSQPTPIDPIASAIRLLLDNGYVVLKAPTWPPHLPVETVRAPPIPVKVPSLASGSHSPDVLSDVREFMSVKQFCSLFSIGRSTAYAHMKSGRLKVQKIGRSTRISRQSVREWLAAEQIAD